MWWVYEKQFCKSLSQVKTWIIFNLFRYAYIDLGNYEYNIESYILSNLIHFIKVVRFIMIRYPEKSKNIHKCICNTLLRGINLTKQIMQVQWAFIIHTNLASYPFTEFIIWFTMHLCHMHRFNCHHLS